MCCRTNTIHSIISYSINFSQLKISSVLSFVVLQKLWLLNFRTNINNMLRLNLDFRSDPSFDAESSTLHWKCVLSWRFYNTIIGCIAMFLHHVVSKVMKLTFRKNSSTLKDTRGISFLIDFSNSREYLMLSAQ